MLQPLFKSVHLLFHHSHLDVEGFMQFHEPIYMGSQPINATLHLREPLIYFLSEIAELKMDATKSGVDLSKSGIDLSKASPNKPF